MEIEGGHPVIPGCYQSKLGHSGGFPRVNMVIEGNISKHTEALKVGHPK